MVLVIILNPILGTLVVLHLKDVHEELVALKTEMLRKNIKRHSFVWVEISVFFFSLSSDGSCGMPVFKITKVFKWYGCKFYLFVLG